MFFEGQLKQIKKFIYYVLNNIYINLYYFMCCIGVYYHIGVVEINILLKY